MSNEEYETLFDFMIPKQRQQQSESAASKDMESEEVKEFTEKLNAGDMTTTAYFISNAILNLLIEKGIVTDREVDKMINDLYQEFKRKRGGRKE